MALSKRSTNSKINEERLMDGLQRLYTKGELTDFQITCRGQTFKVHRVVLCTQSDFFHSVCSGSFKESVSNKIDFPEDNVHGIKRLIEFLYYGNYSDTLDKDHGENGLLSVIDLHVEMYALGDKYGIQGLSKLASTKFNQSCGSAKSKDLLQSIPKIYDLTTESESVLRKYVVEHARRKMGQSSVKNERKTAYKAAILVTPEFGTDLLHSCIDNPSTCNECGSYY